MRSTRGVQQAPCTKPHFLNDFPAYVVFRTAERARENQSGYQALAAQRGNEDLIIPFGGVQSLGRMLDRAAAFNWVLLGSLHDGYTNVNSGRVLFVDVHYVGTHSFDGLDNFGRSLGVAPEVFVARKNIVESLPLEVVVAKTETPQEEVRTVPVDAVRRLLTEHLGYTSAKAGQHLGVLDTYTAHK